MSNKDQQSDIFLDAAIFLATDVFFIFYHNILYMQMEKKYAKVIDDDICNRKIEFKSKSEIMKKEQELQRS